MEISWGIVLEEKSQIFPIRNGSVVIWHHINLQGEYNFADEYLEGAFISEDRGQRTDDGTQRTEIGIWKWDSGILLHALCAMPIALFPFCPQPVTRNPLLVIRPSILR